MVGERAAERGLRVIELPRAESHCVGAWEVMEVLCDRARTNRGVAGFLAVDRYSHGYRLGAPIEPCIRDARELLLRFETGMADAGSLACEPCSIAVAELEDRFVLSATVSHHDWINDVVSAWIEALRGRQRIACVGPSERANGQP